MDKLAENYSEDNYPNICIVGAGISGICAGVKLQTKLGIKSFTIFDENSDFGGTWLVHTYPKCGCDVTTMFYSFSFEPNPEWSSVFCKQEEILKYLKSTAQKHDLYSKAKFNHQVHNFVWEEKIQKWRVQVHDKQSSASQEYLFDFVIAGVGGLRIPNIPEEYENFQGPLMHSAKWDSTVDLEGKVVAVVGSGTSAVQIIPGIVDKVKKLYSFQRRPAWVFPKPQAKLSPGVQRAFKRMPGLQKSIRSATFLGYESFFWAFKKDCFVNSIGAWICKKHMQRQIPNNPELLNKLTPDYKFACKRVAPSNEYYPAMTRPNIEVVRDKITNVKGHSFVTENGKEYEVDVVILATGYKMKEYFAPAKILPNSSDKSSELLENWRRNGPSHYLGVMEHSAPNFFLLMGPNTAVPHSSCVFPIECQMNWIIKVIKKMQKQQWKAVSVKKSAEDRYMTKLLKNLESTVYGAYDCNAFFVDERGIVTVLNSGNLIDYWGKTRKVRWTDLEIS